jgi:hypothetical protein
MNSDDLIANKWISYPLLTSAALTTPCPRSTTRAVTLQHPQKVSDLDARLRVLVR